MIFHCCAVPKEEPKKPKASLLVDSDEEEEEGDLFGSVSAPPAQPKQPTPPVQEEKPKKKVSLRSKFNPCDTYHVKVLYIHVVILYYNVN